MGNANNKSRVILDDYIKLVADVQSNDKQLDPFISVGSGRGYVEEELSNLYKKTIICIDPDPTSFTDEQTDKHGIQPSFATVQECIENHPEYVSECNLLLDWPESTKSTYDIEAISSLKPNVVLIRYGACGASAGSNMLGVLYLLGAPQPTSGMLSNLDIEFTKRISNKKLADKYILVHSHHVTQKMSELFGDILYTAALLVRKDAINKYTFPSKLELDKRLPTSFVL